jgi:hypothetical protein
MSRYAPIQLPPSRLDKLLARGVADHTARPVEKFLKAATWLADEKVLLSAAALFWLSSRRARTIAAAMRRSNFGECGDFLGVAACDQTLRRTRAT